MPSLIPMVVLFRAVLFSVSHFASKYSRLELMGQCTTEIITDEKRALPSVDEKLCCAPSCYVVLE